MIEDLARKLSRPKNLTVFGHALQPSERQRPPIDDESSTWASDLRLVMRVAEGEEKAFEELVDRLACVPRIVAARNERMGRPLADDELADVVQNTLLVVWRKLPDFEGRSTIETWVYRISCLELMSAARRARKRQVRGELQEETLDASVAPERVTSKAYEGLYRALDQLDSEESRVIRLKHFGGHTFERIGAELGLSLDVTKSRYYRGIARLQQALEREEGDPT